MPDWTYHPFFKPLLFRMPAEEGRRLTLGLLELQSRTALGRWVFRLFGHGVPPERVAVTAFGVRFPGPIGLGPGIDTDGAAASVMQYLGFGFLVVGPVAAEPIPRRFATDPMRLAEVHALVASRSAASPGAGAVAALLERLPDLQVPVGMALRGEHLVDALRAARDVPAFFTLPPECADDLAHLAELRAASKRPLLLRISPTWSEEQQTRVLEAAVEAGIEGCVATAPMPTSYLPEGEVSGPFLLPQTLSTITRLRERFGDRLAIVAAGGITTPGDAMACLDAGATLVELHEGLVFAGPGLPGRVLHALEARLDGKHRPPPASVPASSPASVRLARPAHVETWVRIGSALVAFTGMSLIAAGAFALVLAATVKLLPYDVHYLGITVEELCSRGQCRIVHFMAHDRVSFGGSIISIGILYVWLALAPLRAGKPWAWWTVALSGAVGFGSFLTYLGYGYLDLWHGRATLALLPVFAAALVLTFAGLERPRGPRRLLDVGARAWLWSRGGLGRALLSFSAAGMIMGGLVIMTVGMTTVFVPQDLEYMQLTAAELHAISPRLVPLIAHDRAGFGGGLFSGGLTVMLCLWCGARPGARGLWWALLASGLIGFSTAIGIHPIVGYTSFIHLAPAYAGALTFLAAMMLLHRPMCRSDRAADTFPDLG
jgi:dihydroorotate dehydrogenase